MIKYDGCHVHLLYEHCANMDPITHQSILGVTISLFSDESIYYIMIFTQLTIFAQESIIQLQSDSVMRLAQDLRYAPDYL